MDEQLRLDGMGSVAEDRYRTDPLGSELGLKSAGPMAIMTGDQLHPPMVDDEETWRIGDRWHDGAVRHVLRAAARCDLRDGALVIDVGAGLGGPARTLVSEYGVNVVAVNVIGDQLQTMVQLNDRHHVGKDVIHPVLADANEGLPLNRADCVWSMNMLYHLSDHEAFVNEARRVLTPGGVLMIDDWMYTDRAEGRASATMRRHFGSDNLATVQGLVTLFGRYDFQVTDVIDCGPVARTHLARYFRDVVERDFRPELERRSPGRGRETVDDFMDSIEATIELYRNEELTYQQLVARARQRSVR